MKNNIDSNKNQGNGFDALKRDENTAREFASAGLGAAVAAGAVVCARLRIAALKKKNKELKKGLGRIINSAKIKKNEDEIKKLGGTP